MSFQEEMKERIEFIDKFLHKYLPADENEAGIIYEAMAYSVFAGGKRLRPMLMLGAYEAVKGCTYKEIPNDDILYAFAAALEMIHTYSLIHDDLPGMDDDDYRRGKLTNHKVYGEGLAILAGDGLLNLAYETMIQAALVNDCKNSLQAMNIIGKAAGIQGMIGGQVVDLQSENKAITKETLNYIHQNKTAALIQAAVMVGGVLAGGALKEVEKLKEYGYSLGMAFQIQDDILDIISTTEELGKPVNSDIKNGKVTYVSLHGLEDSEEYVKTLSNNALECLSILSEKGAFLRELTTYLVNRRY